MKWMTEVEIESGTFLYEVLYQLNEEQSIQGILRFASVLYIYNFKYMHILQEFWKSSFISLGCLL